MGWALAGTRPHVMAAGREIGGKFNVKDIGGLGSRPNPSDHPFGLALDFMTYADMAKGEAVTAYCLANYKRLGIKYVIWNRRIWNPSQGWRPYNGRSPHTDHPHVSFNAAPGSGPTVDTGGTVLPGSDPAANTATPVGIDLNPLNDIQGALAKIVEVFQAAAGFVKWLTNPKNWLRIAAFLAGFSLLFTGLRKLVGINLPIGGITKLASSAKSALPKEALNVNPG